MNVTDGMDTLEIDRMDQRPLVIDTDDESPTTTTTRVISKTCLCRCFGVCGCSVLVFVPHILLVLSIFFSSGDMVGIWGWHLNAFLSGAVCVCFLSLCAAAAVKIAQLRGSKIDARESGTVIAKYVMIVFGCLLVLTEIALLLLVPTASVFPLEPISHDALRTSEGLDCTQEVLHQRWDEVQRVYNDSVVDFDSIRIVTGGAPFHFNNAGAMVIDDTIYLRDCPSIAVLVHEVVHIWQFQTRWWFGPSGPDRFFSWQIGQMECRSCPYDYGGLDGLATRYAAGITDIRDLGPEQQAEIVEDYYLAGGTDESATVDIYLTHYARQVLHRSP